MSKQITIEENDCRLVFEVLDHGSVAFLHCQCSSFSELDVNENQKDRFRLVEIQTAGEDQDDHHGSKYTGTLPGKRLQFRELKDTNEAQGRRITIVQEDVQTGLWVYSQIQFTRDTHVIETWSEVENKGEQAQVLTYLSSFALTGITKSTNRDWDKSARLKVPSNTWYGEFQWRDYQLPELGLSKVFHYSTKRLSYSATGTWNSHEYLPMGYISNEDSGEGWFFSIQHNGSWHWEVSDAKDALYLQLSGPTENENHWSKELKPGEYFCSVPTATALTNQGFEDAVMEMTKYRRLRRRDNEDNRTLPVIFNDFMNCLEGNPTEEKEYPLIDAASKAGCEYYTIDAGWYADGSWWSKVGEWEPGITRFPNGIGKVLSYIREKGMVPGLWLELEVMGVQCPIAKEKPDNWFFCRHNKRVIDHGRYQLDYRNPDVCAFADQVVKRLVEDYGAGYIKMDYNINAGIGTELDADSVGDGLLEHNRAYLAWLDRIFARYPNLIIENCGSGGMRINDALLLRHSIQSSSDQTDYLRYAPIAAAAPSAVTPEQNAVWSYPMRDADKEQTAFNMVNAMLMRIHQSGHLASLRPESLALVHEGIACYKSYRDRIGNSIPFWPLGLPKAGQDCFALGLEDGETALLAVWNCGEEREIPIPLKQQVTEATLLYPQNLPCSLELDKVDSWLSVGMPGKSARIIQLKIRQGMERNDGR